MAKINKSNIPDKDELASIIADTLNKTFKDRPQSAFLEGEATPTDLVDFASTGCTLLDFAISNRKNGGLPFGRITEIVGMEASGKSLLAAHVMKSVQKMGGVAVLIDTETAVNWEFFDAVGVDRSKNFVYTHLDTVEDVFEAAVKIIESVRNSNKSKPVIIVIDSMAAATTKQEKERSFDKAGYATEKAIIISAGMRKITSTIGTEKVILIITNQLRQKLGAMPFAEQTTTSGGKAIGFHSSVRLKLDSIGKIRIKDEGDSATIGVKVKAKVTKNRLGPPDRNTEFEIFFDRGIDDTASILDYLRDKGIITGSTTAKLTYVKDSGEAITFNGREWREIWNGPLHNEFYEKIANLMVRKYRSDELSEDQMSIENDDDSDNSPKMLHG